MSGVRVDQEAELTSGNIDVGSDIKRWNLKANTCWDLRVALYSILTNLYVVMAWAEEPIVGLEVLHNIDSAGEEH